MTDYTGTIAIAGAVTTIGTAWLTIKKIAKDAQRSRKEHAAEILQSAKEEDVLIRAKLDVKIETMRAELKNLEFNINKDIAHIRDTHTSEIKNLGDKIEALRDELRNQHTGVLNLLARLVEKD